jgi:hypothetical protein
MPEQIKQKTGSADVDRQGHTTTEQYGHMVDAKPTKRVKPRDLNLK